MRRTLRLWARRTRRPARPRRSSSPARASPRRTSPRSRRFRSSAARRTSTSRGPSTSRTCCSRTRPSVRRGQHYQHGLFDLGRRRGDVDLRDLGSNRTLVLINSRRVVGGFGGSPIVDSNVIPTQFIERIDILTGGASSLYGSDAVAGVVNFIYKRNFEGLLMEGQYGMTEKGDWPRYQLSATMGANFAGDRGNIMVHIGYSDDKGLLSRERKNTRVDDLSQFFYTYGPADYGVEHEPYFSSFPVQGRFDVNGTSNPIDDFTFSPAGVLAAVLQRELRLATAPVADPTDSTASSSAPCRRRSGAG